MEVIILGSGTSMGVPMVGCDCRVCQSENPKDKRLRTSAFIRVGDVQILIDTSIDYRQQMLQHGIKRLDAVIYTHHHVDHILGMDDLRSFNFIHRCSIPIYGNRETLSHIKRIFKYAFGSDASVSAVPQITMNEISNHPFQVKGVEITPIPLLHGDLPILGFRIGDFAYCTDTNKIPESSYPLLKNLKVLILDALRYQPHPTHFSVDEAVQEALKIGATETYFTHISHRILHDETEKSLPPGIHLAYDGLRLTL
ncbi:MAG: MBL fold metallo-hydrolase [Calditrichaeota bacterium]|nr:MAG: MBL fold metallo-hydrolase [Calditrichota bacterium]